MYGLDTHKKVIIQVKWSIAVPAIGRRQDFKNLISLYQSCQW